MKLEEEDQIAETMLDAATEIIASNGFEALRVRDVAVKANVALGTPNYKFKSRRGLLLAVLNRATRHFEMHLEQAWQSSLSLPAREAALEFLWARVEFAMQHPHQTLIRAHAVYSNDLEGFRDAISRFADRNLERIIAVANRLHENGVVKLDTDFAKSSFVRAYSFSGHSYAQWVALSALEREPLRETEVKLEVACAFDALLQGYASPETLRNQVMDKYSDFLSLTHS